MGDLIFATTLVRAAIAAGWEVTLLARDYARALLAPTFPELRFIPFAGAVDRLSRKIPALGVALARAAKLLGTLRRERFEAAVSVRPDPRDHLLLWLAGARRRPGFPRLGSELFLTGRVPGAREEQHRVEGWRGLGAALGFHTPDDQRRSCCRSGIPRKRSTAFWRGSRCRSSACMRARGNPSAAGPRPLTRKSSAICGGAFGFICCSSRKQDGYGAELVPLADSVAPPLTLGELVNCSAAPRWCWGMTAARAHRRELRAAGDLGLRAGRCAIGFARGASRITR